ncbi:MAG: biosynthetic peptidoglycan transglycosylase [Bacteroidota bacterium]|nr:biosynthetic peptidoglycan transglycosylase [Bacteroidota bacterium]MDP4192674.1 biosynthetic peptidoglycan transglycosylase [Bacteroidota bacterium]MDP4195747.1 biosynthetic peptidoglycan transglycosylase [Bacteroidota bacterium]
MQFPDNEFGTLFGRYLEKAHYKKFRFGLLYFIVVLYLSVPSFNLPLLEYGHIRISSVMEQRAMENLLLFYPGQSWVNPGNINPNLLRSVVSMEDGKFFRHKGIDWEELEKSMKVNKKRRKMARGGSTITMQLAKNLFLRTDKNVFRKAKEILIATRMEKEVSKGAILGNYLNVIELGDGIFGVKKASEEFFKKDPKDLSLNECLRIAAVIPSPLEHKPTDNSPYVLRRVSLIRERYNDIILPKL